MMDGNVRCWGWNDGGSLGGSSISTNVDLGGATAIDIAAGRSHSCAVLSDGNVRCWGSDASGQLAGSSRL